MPVTHTHAIWTLEDYGDGTFYAEGYSTVVPGDLHHRGGEPLGWFCMDLDDEPMMREQMHLMGFDDAAIDAARTPTTPTTGG